MLNIDENPSNHQTCFLKSMENPIQNRTIQQPQGETSEKKVFRKKSNWHHEIQWSTSQQCHLRVRNLTNLIVRELASKHFQQLIWRLHGWISGQLSHEDATKRDLHQSKSLSVPEFLHIFALSLDQTIWCWQQLLNKTHICGEVDFSGCWFQALWTIWEHIHWDEMNFPIRYLELMDYNFTN